MARFEGPLHQMCDEGEWSEIKSLIEFVENPGFDHSNEHTGWNKQRLEETLLTREGPLGWTPLMILCGRAPIDVIALVCNVQPRACLVSDTTGSLPVHFCAAFRRSPFVEVLLKILCDANPSSVEAKNAWGLTPLHSLLDAKEPVPIGCLRVLLDQGQYTQQALQTRDKKFRLPLHIAAVKKLSTEFLQALVESHREACFETDRSGNLPCHILHAVTRGNADVDSIEALLVPLAIGSARSKRRATMGSAKPTSWSQLVSLTKQAAAFHKNQPMSQLSPRTLAQNACRISGIGHALPLHIAAHYGVKLEILKGICRQYPDAAKLEIAWINMRDEECSADQSHVEIAPVNQSEKLTKGSQNGTQPSTIVEEDEDGDGDDDDDDDSGSRAGNFEHEEHNNSNNLSENSVSPVITNNDKDAGKTLDQDPLGSNNSIENPHDRILDDEDGRGNPGRVDSPDHAKSNANDPWEEESLSARSHSDNSLISDERQRDSDEIEAQALESQQEAQQLHQLTTLCALEIFERGRGFQHVNSAIRMHEAGDIDESNLDDILTYYTRRSDLLLSYHMEAVNKENSQKYLDYPTRLSRLEAQIIQAASASGNTQLSDTVALTWTYLSGYNVSDNPKKYIRTIGHIVTSLSIAGLWKLTVVNLNDRDVFVDIVCTGRTVVQEAELRTPHARMENLLKFYWFQYMLTTFLEPVDALNYSTTCRYARAGGVRLLPQVPLRVTDATWQKQLDEAEIAPPKPWQRIDVMATPDCTHSVFVSFFWESRESQTKESDGGGSQGMLVVRDDNRKLRPNAMEPWGIAVVAHCAAPEVSGSLAQISFKHVPGRSYGLWHYNHGQPGSILSVSDVRVRQLMHSCDPHGRSPLHLLLSSMVAQSASPKLNMHVSMLLAARFGSGDSAGDVPLHYALKCGVSEDVLTSIIAASPSALVETDKEGRTPMHAAFLLSKDEPPALGIIRALLTSPGENAIRLKDSSGRLPIHIATERGAGEAILRMLIEAYPDGCYRTNKYGDLPLHLLLKSGAATTTTVELLLRPIMQNETICKIGGAQGTNLPLHIAAEYQCSFKILEKLLVTYGDAALVPRVYQEGKSRERVDGQFSLDIFENANNNENFDETEQEKGIFRAKDMVSSADFSLRSDLIFVYNPLLDNETTGKPYRSDRERIRRLENMIKREASQCGEDRKTNRRAKLSDMALQGWIFLCTYSNHDDASDNFAGTVRRILRGMSANAVDVLAHAQNSKSLPTPNMMIKDCATPVCHLLIMSRLRFVGRYVLYDEIHPVHKSESCLVMKAKDHGLEDEYKRFMAIYDAKEQQVEDDISDAGSEPPELSNVNEPNEVRVDMFVNFAVNLGVKVSVAREEVLNLIALDSMKDNQPYHRSGLVDEGPHSMITGASEEEETFGGDEDTVDTKKRDPDDENALSVGKEAFTTFCRAHRLNEKGVRTVVIKFMKSHLQFKSEIDVRDGLDLNGTTWPVVPILDQYSVDRIEASRRKDIDIMTLRDDMAEEAISGAPENRDELYALDILEKNASVHNFALYKYAVVMPAGDRDLGEICEHEELGILQIRECMLQVGTALQSLHAASIIHGDLKVQNIVRFGKNMALIDFDGAHRFPASTSGEKMGGASSKFCTGVLPPEMIARIDLVTDYQKLVEYEEYWRRISEDAKDLNLLTPDDVQTISSVTKSLLGKADVARNLRKHMPLGLRDEINSLYNSLEDRNDWKDILSVALMTLSFDDLPFSLNRCSDVEEFAQVWNRILFHSGLWKKVKPRISPDEKYAYLIKTYDDIEDEKGLLTKPESSRVPYALVDPSDKIDIWGFGVLLFSLCSGGSLFHLGFDGDLLDSEDFRELFEWNRSKAERLFREKVVDPLAHDLLLKILAPADSRLKTMSAVLKHPFFGPSSSPEAQRILERHEEEQLIFEETVVINRMTNETRRKVERSMERHCKIIFDNEKIVVPTCLIVLPYTLERDGDSLVVKSQSGFDLAAEVGRTLLEINRVTATLSFFLLMKRSTGPDKAAFKSRFTTWIRRYNSSMKGGIVDEILKEIKCGEEYAAICNQVLKDGENQAMLFFVDPMASARKYISECRAALVQIYEHTQKLYLVDEMNGVPVRSEDTSNNDDDETVYPIALDRSHDTHLRLLLPFINITVMKVTAAEGLPGLGKLLGLPKPSRVPTIWVKGKAGLVHRPNKPSTIAEFAVLHEVLSRQGESPSSGNALSLSHPDVVRTGDEMSSLEDFFRDLDPMRTFADLHRVADGKEGSPAVWTTEAEVNRIQGEIELALLEYELRELKKEWIKRHKMQEEIQTLTQRIENIRGAKSDDRRLNGSGKIPTGPRDPPKSAGNLRATQSEEEHYLNDPRSSIMLDPEGAAEQRREKRRKMRFRPFIGGC